ELHRFVVLPKRWPLGSSPMAERSLAWISRNHHLARDFESHAIDGGRIRRRSSSPSAASP
ncbi:MAG: hypothetical protein ACREER_05440, partial [Alphaproteobacteria bacterium]